MTCLAVWRGRDATIVGTDSQWTEGSQRGTVREGKMWRNGKWIIAGSGSFRAIQLLRYGPQFDGSVSINEAESHLVCRWMPEFQKHMKEHGGIVEEDGEAPRCNLWALFVHKRGIIRVSSDFTVLRDPHRYAANGSGEEVALGYLAAQSLSNGSSARRIVRGALEAAEEHIEGVRGPFHFMEAR